MTQQSSRSGLKRRGAPLGNRHAAKGVTPRRQVSVPASLYARLATLAEAAQQPAPHYIRGVLERHANEVSAVSETS